MKLSPSLHALHSSWPAEVIAIAVLTQPAALAGQLAGMLASGLRTVSLTICRARIRKKKQVAMTAFSSSWRAAHDEPNLRRIQ
jgi:hypothetical protein